MAAVVFDFRGLELALLPEKAIWIESLRILLLADLHFGKASHFRKAGIPIPEQVHDLDYIRIEKLIQKYNPAHTYFLGDLFHSSWNEQWEDLLTFLSQFQESTFHLVHAKSVILESLLLSHEPITPPEGMLTVCGHIHPGILLKGKGKQSVRIPCFHYSEDVLVMPSFGNFTGLFLINGKKSDYLWGIAEERVIPILSPTVIG